MFALQVSYFVVLALPHEKLGSERLKRNYLAAETTLDTGRAQGAIRESATSRVLINKNTAKR